MTGNTHTCEILSSNPTVRLGQDRIWVPQEGPDNLQVGHVESVSLTISCPFFFSVSLKFRACYIMVQWGDLTVKNLT